MSTATLNLLAPPLFGDAAVDDVIEVLRAAGTSGYFKITKITPKGDFSVTWDLEPVAE